MNDQSVSFRFAQLIVVAIFSILSGFATKFLWVLAPPIVHWIWVGFLVVAWIFWVVWASNYWKRAAHFNSPEWYPWLVLAISIVMIYYGFWSYKVNY